MVGVLECHGLKQEILKSLSKYVPSHLAFVSSFRNSRGEFVKGTGGVLILVNKRVLSVDSPTYNTNMFKSIVDGRVARVTISSSDESQVLAINVVHNHSLSMSDMRRVEEQVRDDIARTLLDPHKFSAVWLYLIHI